MDCLLCVFQASEGREHSLLHGRRLALSSARVVVVVVVGVKLSKVENEAEAENSTHRWENRNEQCS